MPAVSAGEARDAPWTAERRDRLQVVQLDVDAGLTPAVTVVMCEFCVTRENLDVLVETCCCCSVDLIGCWTWSARQINRLDYYAELQDRNRSRRHLLLK